MFTEPERLKRFVHGCQWTRSDEISIRFVQPGKHSTVIRPAPLLSKPAKANAGACGGAIRTLSNVAPTSKGLFSESTKSPTTTGSLIGMNSEPICVQVTPSAEL